MEIPLTGFEAMWGIGALALTGWNLYLGSEKRALQKEITNASNASGKDSGQIRRDLDRVQGKLDLIERQYWTRDDHKEFRLEVLALIEKMNGTLTAAIERLGERLDKVVENGRRQPE